MSKAPDYQAIKGRQRQVWDTGDYAAVAHQVQILSEVLVSSARLLADQRVLDVAAGSGNASIAAARRGCRVTALDYVPSLLQRASDRAEAERLPLETVEGDAEDLPFDDGEFDAVISSLGVMFAPDQETAAAELARVCRSGGTIALAVWPADDFVGDLFAALRPFVTAPPGVRPPFEWSSAQRLEELFGEDATEIEIVDREVSFTSPTREDFVNLWTQYYGPTTAVHSSLDDDGKRALETALGDLGARRDTNAESDALLIPARYNEVLIKRS